jgi:hypothetical protein
VLVVFANRINKSVCQYRLVSGHCVAPATRSIVSTLQLKEFQPLCGLQPVSQSLRRKQRIFTSNGGREEGAGDLAPPCETLKYDATELDL